MGLPTDVRKRIKPHFVRDYHEVFKIVMTPVDGIVLPLPGKIAASTGVDGNLAS